MVLHAKVEGCISLMCWVFLSRLNHHRMWFKPSPDVELVYAEPVGPVSQVVNMYNGLIGLSVAKPTNNTCEQYAEWTKSPKNYYGTGQIVGAKYRVVKLGAPGAFTWGLPVETYFTRRDTDAGWVNMGSLSGVANKDNY
ncbi:TPA: hypothetical protein ACYZ9D_004984, partial [Escherichia coli]